MNGNGHPQEFTPEEIEELARQITEVSRELKMLPNLALLALQSEEGKDLLNVNGEFSLWGVAESAMYDFRRGRFSRARGKIHRLGKILRDNQDWIFLPIR